MPITAQDICNKFAEPHSGKGGRSAIPEGGNMVPMLGRRLDRNPAPPPPGPLAALALGGPANYGLVNTAFPPGPLTGVVTEVAAATHATLIEDLYVPNHRDVTSDAAWRRIYQHAVEPIRFRNPAGATVVQNIPCIPCHFCGVILPEQFIQVDHRQPQAHPGVAVLKVLHAMPGGGYTTAAGHGTKSTQAAAIAAIPPGAGAAAAAHLAQSQVRGYAWNHAWVGGAAALLLGDAQHRNRYTITPQGKTFLAICSMLWGIQGTQDRCLNSILNLVPICAACNGAGGKGSRTHAR